MKASHRRLITCVPIPITSSAACQVLVEQRDFRRLEKIFPAIILFYEMNNQRVELQEVVRILDGMQQQLRQELETITEEGSHGLPRSFYQSLLALTLAALYHFTESYQSQPHTVLYQQESLGLIQTLPDSQSKAYAICSTVLARG